MNATLRFIDPKMKQAQPKLMTLGKSKLLELLVEDDDTLLELAEGGEVNGNTFDDVDRMTIKELRVALRESRETAEAKDKVIADKNKKVDELAEKLSKKQTGVKEPKPADVGIELTMQLGSLTAWKSVSARKSADCAICSSRWRRTARRMDLTTARRWSACSIKLFWTASNCAKAMPYRPKHRQTMCRNGWAVKREKAMNPAMIERLKAVENQAEAMGRGARSAYLKQQAQELGISLATLYRKLEAVSVKPTRKRRSDAGKTELKPEEAKLISAVLAEAMRRNGKRLMPVRQAVEMLRANGKIEAARIDGETGEVIPLSENTITRALREYKLHSDQLLQPDPVSRMKSEHPNHCWQIDPSLCVLYFLPRQGKDTGLRVMKEEEFYKNKPKNVVKIENDRVWRYTGTDHASGTISVRYYFGGETSANLCDFFIYMMQAKKDIGKDPFRTVPRMVMLDPGSANTSAAFKNLCKPLDVHVQINKPGNPRAKGQVEKANDIVETAFESGLRFTEVHDIDQLNALSERWMRYYNGTQKHSRHGMTRYQAWNKIKPEQLILPPPAEYCRELAVSAPKEAKVSADLEIRFGGRVYSVKGIKGILVGKKVLVGKNPWEANGARVATYDAEGNEVWVSVPEVVFDEMGFKADAAVIGAEYKAPADTDAQRHRKELDKLAMGAETLEAAAAKRKGKAVPFGGKIDPYKHQEDTLAASNTLFMPKQGQQMDYNKMEVAEQVLSKVEIAKRLKPRVEADGGDWKQAVSVILKHYPEGVTEGRLEEAFERTRTRCRLKLLKTG